MKQKAVSISGSSIQTEIIENKSTTKYSLYTGYEFVAPSGKKIIGIFIISAVIGASGGNNTVFYACRNDTTTINYFNYNVASSGSGIAWATTPATIVWNDNSVVVNISKISSKTPYFQFNSGTSQSPVYDVRLVTEG